LKFVYGEVEITALVLRNLRPAEGRWYVLTASYAFMTQQFGINGDIPTESAFVY